MWRLTKIMITINSSMNTNCINNGYHLFPFRNITHLKKKKNKTKNKFNRHTEKQTHRENFEIKKLNSGISLSSVFVKGPGALI